MYGYLDWKTYHTLGLYFVVIHTNSYSKQRYSLSDDTTNKQQQLGELEKKNEPTFLQTTNHARSEMFIVLFATTTNSTFDSFEPPYNSIVGLGMITCWWI